MSAGAHRCRGLVLGRSRKTLGDRQFAQVTTTQNRGQALVVTAEVVVRRRGHGAGPPEPPPPPPGRRRCWPAPYRPPQAPSPAPRTGKKASTTRYPTALSLTPTSNSYTASGAACRYCRSQAGLLGSVYRYGKVQVSRFASWGSSATVLAPRMETRSAATAPAHSPAVTTCRARASPGGSRLPRTEVRRAAAIPAAMVIPSTSSNASTRAASYALVSQTLAICSGWPMGGSAYMTRATATPALMPTARAAGAAGGRRAVAARSPAT